MTIISRLPSVGDSQINPADIINVSMDNDLDKLMLINVNGTN